MFLVLRMRLSHLLLLGSLAGVLPVHGAPTPDRAFLEKHCVECHDADVQKGDLDLTTLTFDLTQPLNFREWARVHDRVKAGEMPPPKKARPEAGELEGFLGGLRSQLVEADSQRQAIEGRT
ncbi:MAG: c-type cytochrome domain-containing protein, partial [Prosthecobacter sp.]